MTDSQWIDGYCPMGCGRTLFRVPDSDKIVCRYERCPFPDVVSVILSDRETEHVVTFEATDRGHAFTVRHPLRERLDSELITCSVEGYLRSLTGPPKPSGRYRMTKNPGRRGYHYEDLGYVRADHGMRIE